MPQYLITGTRNNTSYTRVFNAVSETQARALARQLGIQTSSVQLKTHASSRAIPREDFLEWIQMPARCLESHIQMTEALAITRTAFKTKKTLVTMIEKISIDLEHGETFSTAIKQHPQAFDPVFSASIAASEAAGNIAYTLRLLYHRAKTDEKHRKEFLSGMAYPCFLIAAVFIVAIFFGFQVTPKVFLGFKNKMHLMPPLSLYVLNLTLVAAQLWFVLLPGIALALYLAFTHRGFQNFLSTFGARLLPNIRRFQHLSIQARVFNIMGLCIRSGISTTHTLTLIQDLVKNTSYNHPMTKVSEDIRQGISLSAAFEKNVPTLDPLLFAALKVGDATGKVDEQLEIISKHLDERVNEEIIKVRMVIAQIFFLGAAFIVALFLSSVYTAFFSMSKTLR